MEFENARIVEKVCLPSKGLVYEEDVNPEIELSSMKTKHEMMRLSATDGNQKVMANIIDDCIVSDMGISSYDLCLGDFQYLLYKLRVVTFGPEYEMQCRCPYCGFENTVTLNIDELNVNEYSDSIIDLLEMDLPISGNHIKLTMQTPRILDRINSRIKETNQRRRNSDENLTVLYTILSCIEEIDDEPIEIVTAENWVRELPLADSNAILYRINELNDCLGIELDSLTTCKICRSTFLAPFRVNDSFFRPDPSL